jgi:hypothetical protein
MIQLPALVHRHSCLLLLSLWRPAVITAQTQSPRPTLTVEAMDIRAVTVRAQTPVYVVAALRDRLGNLRLLFPNDSGVWRRVADYDTLMLQRALPIPHAVLTPPRQCIHDRETDRVWDAARGSLEARTSAECGPPRGTGESSPFMGAFLIIVAAPTEEEPGGLSKVFARYSRTESLTGTTLRFVRAMCPIRFCRDWEAVFVPLH